MHCTNDRIGRNVVFAAVVASLGLLVSSSASASVYNDAVLADNPRYYWTFDEPDAVNGGALGDALNSGAGAGGTLKQGVGTTRVGSTTTTGGLSLGSAASFSAGGSSWFYTDSTTTQNGVAAGVRPNDGTYSSYAIEFWINRQAATSNNYISEVGAFGSANTPSVIYGFTNGQQNDLELFSQGGRTDTAGPALTVGSWHHVVIGFKDNAGADVTTFILDGNVAGATTSTGVTNQVYNANIEPFIIGADITGGSRPQMLLDEYAIYDLSSLSQSEFDAKLSSIASHSSASTAPEPSTLLLSTLAMMGMCIRRRHRSGRG